MLPDDDPDPEAIMRQSPQLGEPHFRFEPPEWMNTLAEQVAGVNGAIERLADGLVKAAEAARRHLDAYLTQNADAIAAIGEGLKQIHERWVAFTPPAWRELEGDQLLRVLRLGEETGICLVWAPRAEIIVETLSAWDPKVGDASPALGILDAHRDAVLNDLQAALDEVTGTQIVGHAEATQFAVEAVAAARDGHLYAAQALAASGLGQVLHVTWAFGGLGKAYRQFSAVDMEEAALSMIKSSLIQLATAVALTNTDRASFAGFNRHGTHHGKREFFSAGNALAGLLLLVAWVRELQWVADEFPDALNGDRS